MAEKENIFTFDTMPFMNGLKKIGSGISGLTKNAANMAKNVSKGIINATAKIGLLAVAFKGVRSAIQQMPEIGKAFNIAKNIIAKNLLFPLRKAVFPLLQKFLNWVRDNRAMFVKWGQTLANIFQVIVGAVGKIIEIGKKLGKVFMDFINKTFGMQIKTFQELINVLTFKMAVVIEFLKALIDPVFEAFSKIADVAGTLIAEAFETLISLVGGFVTGMGNAFDIVGSILDTIKRIVENLFTANEQGNSMKTVFETVGEIFGGIFKWIASITDSFLKGLEPAIKNIMTPIQKIVDAFQRIFDLLFGSEDALKFWNETFAFLGEVVGVVLVAAFETIATVIEIIEAGLTAIIDAIKWVVDNIGGVLEAVGGFFGDVATGVGDVISWVNPFDDVIITKKGQVIPVSPEDNIVAFKDGSPLMGNGETAKTVNISINFPGMQLIAQNTTTDEAEKFGEQIVSAFRNQLTMELERNGIF